MRSECVWLKRSGWTLGLLALAGCLSVNQDGSAGSGGESASGGLTASGGLMRTGGIVAGSGGVIASGGVITGGVTTTGGVSVTGGLMNTGGGTAETGGTATTGGSEETGGSMATCQPLESFDLSCEVDADCIAVSLPGCCTGEYVGAPPEMEAALEENQWLCDPSPAVCDCAYMLSRTQDGTYVGYGDEARAYCDAGTCRTSAAVDHTCGDKSCAADTYCLIELPGAAGSEPRYNCPPLVEDCADCGCLMSNAFVSPPCDCQDTNAGPQVTCAYP